MAVAEDLDRATDSTWDWAAEQTRTMARIFPLYDEYAQKTDRQSRSCY